MKSLVTVVVLMFATVAAHPQTGKPCEELKGEIAKKIEANGVKSYSLEIVPTEKAKDSQAKIVGSCEGGAKKIVYSKTTAPASKPEASASSAEPNKQ